MGVLRIHMSSRVISQIVSDFHPRHDTFTSVLLVEVLYTVAILGPPSTALEANTTPPNSQH